MVRFYSLKWWMLLRVTAALVRRQELPRPLRPISYTWYASFEGMAGGSASSNGGIAIMELTPAGAWFYLKKGVLLSKNADHPRTVSADR